MRKVDNAVCAPERVADIELRLRAQRHNGPALCPDGIGEVADRFRFYDF